MFRAKSFQNLLSIATHPVFPKYVKSIFYEAAIIRFGINDEVWKFLVTEVPKHVPAERKQPKFPTGCQWKSSVLRWEREMHDWEVFFGPRPEYSEVELTEGWSAFEEIQKETAYIAQSNEDGNAIKAAFQLFPNLEEICMATDNKATEAMKRTYKDALLLPTSEIPHFADELDPCDLDDDFTGTRQLSSLLEASVAAGHKLKCLNAANISWTWFGNNLSDPDWAETAWENSPAVWDRFHFRFDGKLWAKPYHKDLESAFHNLTHLNFRFERDSMEDGEFEVRRFGEAIRSAKNLESLTLDFGDTTAPMHFRDMQDIPTSLEQLMGPSPLDEVIWPHLTFLELHSVEATHARWVAFMKAHSHTLRDVHLSSLVSNSLFLFELPQGKHHMNHKLMIGDP